MTSLNAIGKKVSLTTNSGGMLWHFRGVVVEENETVLLLHDDKIDDIVIVAKEDIVRYVPVKVHQ